MTRLGTGVRLDCGIKSGDEVSVNFDPMVAKLITYGVDRSQAISKMLLAINENPFLGLTSNREYLKKVLAHKDFIDGKTFTNFINEHPELGEKSSSKREIAIAALANYLLKGQSSQGEDVKRVESDEDFFGFRNYQI